MKWLTAPKNRLQRNDSTAHLVPEEAFMLIEDGIKTSSCCFVASKKKEEMKEFVLGFQKVSEPRQNVNTPAERRKTSTLTFSLGSRVEGHQTSASTSQKISFSRSNKSRPTASTAKQAFSPLLLLLNQHFLSIRRYRAQTDPSP